LPWIFRILPASSVNCIDASSDKGRRKLFSMSLDKKVATEIFVSFANEKS
jgi:hypothetical protein